MKVLNKAEMKRTVGGVAWWAVYWGVKGALMVAAYAPKKGQR